MIILTASSAIETFLSIDQRKSHTKLTKYLLKAVRRLFTWNECVSSSSRELLQKIDEEGEPFSHTASPNRISNAVYFLLAAAANDKNLQLELSGAKPGTSLFLASFNEDLTYVNLQDQHPSLGIGQLIKKLYRLFRGNRCAALATLALYDVHMDRFVERRSQNKDGEYPLDLLRPVFKIVAEGFNLWIIRRRWQSIYYEYHEHSEVDAIRKRYHSFKSHRDKRAKKFINDLKAFPQSEHGLEDVSPYQRTYTSLMLSGLVREQLLRAVFLKVTCKTLEDCYLVEMWAEKQGEVVGHLTRKSLFFPEENGTRRLQIGVRCREDNGLLILRIGTAEIHHENEWGSLVKMYNRTWLKGLRHVTPDEDEITIYKWTGHAVALAKDSTVADLVIQEYSINQAQHCTDVFVNGSRVKMGYQLAQDDVVQIIIDRHLQKRLLLQSWLGPHKSDRTHAAINDLYEQTKYDSVRGRRRLMHLLQTHLEPWNGHVEEDQLSQLLRLAGFSLDQELEEIFKTLATDLSKDDLLRDLALKYNLRNRLAYTDGNIVEYNWRKLYLAKCCHPTANDQLIGNRIAGPRNPQSPRYGLISELKIHRHDCKDGPSHHNAVDLRLLPQSKTKPTQYGLRVSITIDHRDKQGVLGQLLAYLARYAMTIRFVTGDAINFGKNNAQITFFAVSENLWTLEDVKFALEQKYGEENVTANILQPDEAREIIQSGQANPYITSSEPEVDRNVPRMVVGRERETRQLRSLLMHDDKVNIALIGYYRTGKTWFLSHFRQTHTTPRELLIYFPFDAYSRNYVSDKDIVRGIYSRTLRAINDSPIAGFADVQQNRPTDFYQLSQWLTETASITGLRFTLLLDEFSLVNEWQEHGHVDVRFSERFHRFMNDTPKTNFVLVFQSALYYGLLPKNESFLEYFLSRSDSQILMEPFTDEQLADLLCHPAKGRYALSEGALQFAMELSGGIPFIVAQLGKSIWHRATRDNVACVTEAYLNTLVRDEIIIDSQWQAYLNRMVEKLFGLPLQLLQVLASLQTDADSKADGDVYITSDEIALATHERLAINKDQCYDILQSLFQARLVDKRQEAGLSWWRVGSGLLARHLAADLLLEEAQTR